MTQEMMVTELLTMRKRAEQTAQNIDQIARNLYTERQSLQQVISDYDAKRIELLKEKLRAREMTWCTYCSVVLPEGKAEFLFVEGREHYTHGYGNAYYGFRAFSKLHRACPACRERANDQHGQTGTYDSQAKDQASFYAFRVEKREDGYYARKFGSWVKLEDEKCNLPEPSSQLVERLAEEWDLPPRITFDHQNDKLVIHE